MGCCGSDSVLVSKMATEVRSGPMLWYKKRFLRSNWRNVHCVLYSDSSLIWYKDKTRQDKEGALELKEAPELLVFVPYTSQVFVPHTIQFLNRHSDNYVHKKMMAVGVRGKNILHCFLCQDEEDVQNWMGAVLTTIPHPPPHLRASLYLTNNQNTSYYPDGKQTKQPSPQRLTGTKVPNPQQLPTTQTQKLENGYVATTDEGDKDKGFVGGGSLGVGMLLGGALGAIWGGGQALPQGSKGNIGDHKRLMDYYPDLTDDLVDERAALTEIKADDNSVHNDALVRDRMVDYQMRQGAIEYNPQQGNEYNPQQVNEYNPQQSNEYNYKQYDCYNSAEHGENDMYDDGGIDMDFGGDNGDYMACFAVF